MNCLRPAIVGALRISRQRRGEGAAKAIRTSISLCRPTARGFISSSCSPSRISTLLPRSANAYIHCSAAKNDSAERVASPSPSSNEDPTEQPSPPSEKIAKLVDEISTLTLLEIVQLTELLRVKLNIPSMPMGMMPMGMGMPMPGMVPGGAGMAGGAEAAEEKVEKTEFDVKLEKFAPESKIKIIKEVRALTALGLKEAKELVEKAPTVIKKGVGKDEANQIIEKLKALGATCALE